MSQGFELGAAAAKLKQEEMRAQMIDSLVMSIAKEIYVPLVLDVISEASEPHAGELDPEDLRAAARGARMAAPYLLEAFGMVKIPDNPDPAE